MKIVKATICADYLLLRRIRRCDHLRLGLYLKLIIKHQCASNELESRRLAVAFLHKRGQVPSNEKGLVGGESQEQSWVWVALYAHAPLAPLVEVFSLCSAGVLQLSLLRHSPQGAQFPKKQDLGRDAAQLQSPNHLRNCTKPFTEFHGDLPLGRPPSQVTSQAGHLVLGYPTTAVMPYWSSCFHCCPQSNSFSTWLRELFKM